jgi:hypothetical protein
MHEFTVYKHKNSANIEPLSIKRDWMDDTYNAHAYHCFPISSANKLGWGISFPKDIVFIWDGTTDTSGSHVKIIQGEEYCYTERGNATISFHTGLVFKTSENLSLLQMPVPNQFIDGVQAFTTLMSTSFFNAELPCAWKITKANTPIIIKANTPIISVFPISLGELQNSSVIIDSMDNLKKSDYDVVEYGNAIDKITSQGKWSDFYRNAVDHNGNKIGKHEIKSLKLNVKEKY